MVQTALWAAIVGLGLTHSRRECVRVLHGPHLIFTILNEPIHVVNGENYELGHDSALLRVIFKWFGLLCGLQSWGWG
jgi:hypothetical protein